MAVDTKKLPDLIPLEVLLGNPEKIQPQLSPDGKKMAFIAPVRDVLNVWVGDVGKDHYQPVTKDTDRGIRAYFWAYDNTHILYIQDKGGDENWRLYSVNLSSGAIRDLTPFENVQARVVSRNKDFPHDLLIGLNKDNPQAHDVYHLELASGALELVAKNPGNIVAWVTDRELKVRAAMAATAEGGFDLLYRESEDDDFHTLLSWPSDDALASGPIEFTRDGKSLFLIDSRDANAGRLVKLDVASGTIEVLAEDPTYDVDNVMIHPDTYEVQAVAFNRDRVEWQVLDPTVANDFKTIATLHRGDFFVVNRDLADETWLVAFTVDNTAVPYYAYDCDTKKATFLFQHRSDWSQYTMAEVEPIEFKSRDGLTIHGYITFPVDLERQNLPMVLNVHGGPWSRDTWGMNPEAQWFANRGYISLQVNFRGSTGHGKDFVNAGDREWAGKMHDDLIDAVNWAIEEGYADPKQIAIFGGSYGGFSALVGATFTPDVFCCSVDFVGISNIISWINGVPPYWKPLLEMFYKRVGHPEKDKEFLESRSPLFRVDQIKIPMLIAQGANDPRVPLRESDQIVAALKDRGIDHEYMVFEDEGHGFAKPENRLKFYRAADQFLAKNLGGRAE
ncbi:MAG: S9 family peptidase [Candidatus Tectomicrobia bacterium]